MPAAFRVLLLPLLAYSFAASACNPETGEREQTVALLWEGRTIAEWTVDGPAPHRVALPNGFELGVAIEPAAAEKYTQLRAGFRHVPELVRIELFDLGAAEPRALTQTWGGANSLQGYGAAGGADRVAELGDPGILLVLAKPLCATAPETAPRPAAPAQPAAPATPATPPDAASPAAPATAPSDRFGLRDAPARGADEVRSEVEPGFRGWGPNSRIRLANGQVWQVIDGSAATLGRGVGPGARVVRGLFGTYYLEIDGLNKAPKVRRVE